MRFPFPALFLLLGSCYAGLTSRATEEECHFQYFTQNIDHSGQHDGTFAQRYSVNTEYYKPGGPVFYFQGSEGHEVDCVVSARLKTDEHLIYLAT